MLITWAQQSLPFKQAQTLCKPRTSLQSKPSLAQASAAPEHLLPPSGMQGPPLGTGPVAPGKDPLLTTTWAHGYAAPLIQSTGTQLPAVGTLNGSHRWCCELMVWGCFTPWRIQPQPCWVKSMSERTDCLLLFHQWKIALRTIGQIRIWHNNGCRQQDCRRVSAPLQQQHKPPGPWATS